MTFPLKLDILETSLYLFFHGGRRRWRHANQVLLLRDFKETYRMESLCLRDCSMVGKFFHMPHSLSVLLWPPLCSAARWWWVAMTSVKIPFSPEKQNYYSRKCTSLILEQLSFSPWVVKTSLWIFSVHSGQVLRMNNLFSVGRKPTSFQQECHSSPFLLKLPVWFFISR